jgi:hypothetical protein
MSKERTYLVTHGRAGILAGLGVAVHVVLTLASLLKHHLNMRITF